MMTDPIAQLCQLALQQLQERPDLELDQRVSALQAAISANSELSATLQADSRALQINQGNAKAFQTLVTGGIANIGGIHLSNTDGETLKTLLEEYFRSSKPTGTPHNLPRSGAVTFVGRNQILQDLHQQLHQSDRLAIVVIQGMGGIGKTELALQYAWQQQAQGYPGGIVWIQARQEIGLQVVQSAQTQLNLAVPEDSDLTDQVQWCWRHWIAGDTLLIFDDVQAYADVEPWLQGLDPQFKVLLTTRLTLGPSVRSIKLPVLDREHSLEFLRTIVPDGRIDTELDVPQALCEWLGDLPLGLELIGRYLTRKPDCSLAKLQQRLADRQLEAKALKTRDPAMTATLGVAAAFELSWQELSAIAQTLAAFLSLFALAEFPWQWVQDCWPNWNEEELEDTRDEQLLSLHLLRRTGNDRYQLHQLLREFFTVKRQQINDLNPWYETFSKVIYDAAESSSKRPEQSLLAETRLVMPHLQAAIAHKNTTESPLEAAFGIFWLANLYYAQGRYSQAELLYQQALKIRQRQLGDDHPDVAGSLNNLANLYHAEGRYSKAKPLLQQALEIRQRQLGDDHPDVATSLHNLAELYRAQGCYREAETLYQQARTIMQQQVGNDHPNVATNLNNLAELYRAQGRYSEAGTLYQQALKIRQGQLGKDHPDVASSLNNLASLYQSQSRYSEAETLYQQALKIWQQHLGKYHPDVASNLNNLASLYQSQGRYSEAETLYQQALKIVQQQLGEDHPYVAINLNNLASLYQSQSRYSEAETLHQQALRIKQQQLGEDHPSVASSLNNLANLYRVQGLYSEAEPFYQQALEIQQRQLGNDHPNVAISLHNLANLYRAQGRYSEAEPLIQQALEIVQQQLGNDHPDVATNLNNLANLYQDQARYSNAEPLYQQALKIRQQQLGEDHPLVASSLNNLASLYQDQGRYSNAEPLYSRALDIYESVLGASHPTTMMIRQNYALCLKRR